ncbi:MAG: glycosyltransferase [Bacteroidota bacterium]|nr:glycosyltransferase [Bacteroidota bacterium]
MSVVLAAYNAERFIGAAIESILSQTYRDLELVIIDDHSTDTTAKRIAAQQANDPRIRVLQNPANIGQLASLNKGILVSRGEFIAIMDADDICDARRIELQVAYLEKNPHVGVVGCLTDAFEEDVSVTRSSGARADSTWLDGNIVMAHPSMMVRKQIYAFAGLYDTRKRFATLGDYELQSRFGYRGVQMHVIDQVLLHYRVHPRNMTNSRRKEQVGSYLYVTFHIIFYYRRNLTARGWAAFIRYLSIYIYLSLRLYHLIPRSLGKQIWPVPGGKDRNKRSISFSRSSSDDRLNKYGGSDPSRQKKVTNDH